MNDNELDLLNIESPTGKREPPTPDPEAILPLLSHPETKQRMLAARGKLYTATFHIV